MAGARTLCQEGHVKQILGLPDGRPGVGVKGSMCSLSVELSRLSRGLQMATLGLGWSSLGGRLISPATGTRECMPLPFHRAY